MFYSCDKKGIKELKKKVQEIETLKGQFSVINAMKENLAKYITTCENQLNKILEIIQQNIKTNSNQSLFGVYFIKVQKEFIGCMSILGAVIIAYCSIILTKFKTIK